MSSTITPRKAITSGRPSASAASTTPPTTGCMPDQPRYYNDFTGSGNALNVDPSPRAADGAGLAALLGRRCMSTASASIWPRTLARGPDGFDPQRGFFAAIRQDPGAAGTSSSSPSPGISAPAAISSAIFPRAGPNGTTAIATPAPLLARRRGHLLGDVAARITGSADLFDHDGRGAARQHQFRHRP